MAKSLLNDNGVRHNGSGMLLGRLNVVNVGLLSGAGEDEYRSGGPRGKSRRRTSIHCWGGSRLTNTWEGFFFPSGETQRRTQRAGEGPSSLWPLIQIPQNDLSFIHLISFSNNN